MINSQINPYKWFKSIAVQENELQNFFIVANFYIIMFYHAFIELIRFGGIDFLSGDCVYTAEHENRKHI